MFSICLFKMTNNKGKLAPASAVSMSRKINRPVTLYSLCNISLSVFQSETPISFVINARMSCRVFFIRYKAMYEGKFMRFPPDQY